MWRPVAGQAGKYTLVGSNSAQTEEGRVTLINVPAIYQIKVQANDVIGFQFPKGATGVAWSSCNNNKVNMMSYERKSSWSNPEPGTEVTFDSLASYYPCRMFSVSAVVEPGGFSNFNPHYNKSGLCSILVSRE